MPATAPFPDPLRAEWEEARPRDFAARFARRTQGAGRKPVKMPRRWTLGVTALAAIALPAFAAPGEWNRFQIADAVKQDAAVAPMPFEQAGSSFPGSAFYYLEAAQPVQQVGEGIHSDADDPAAGPTLGNGPVARPLYADNPGVDRTRALQCMTAAIYYEAASESDAGQRAVAQVVLNRVAHPAFPDTVCGVVYQGSERSTGCQFSFTCDGSLARRPVALFWNRAETIARQALAGHVYATVGLATHYHTVQVHPYWAPSLHYLGTIGEHRFYSFNGPAGNPGSFHFAYFGGEPAARPHARTRLAEPDPGLDPVTLQRAFARPDLPTPAATPTAASLVAQSTPNYTRDLRDRGGDAVYRARNLPEAHGIKPEFANTGRWIAQPGS
ncbi:cell wall hydrolase [Novosphingobium album (ex Hu et al. 2023)]|uniref:Cell wall hydrolase n=1 Tax=Novosphingobium album (ex Hu et al. 2023) TaxID=2930093 RepID=A0ABT0B1C9_9SPHN|nr:cell wall hydrolase [Novosphingobium album (ex Hu et al. 2023)]MCJ2178886.1 cell wall hydrolase [Novosphingobium album (ex Hu et al. 2023)]